MKKKDPLAIRLGREKAIDLCIARCMVEKGLHTEQDTADFCGISRSRYWRMRREHFDRTSFFEVLSILDKLGATPEERAAIVG